MEVVVTTGAISRAKLQSNHHHQQTNTELFTGWTPFLSLNTVKALKEIRKSYTCTKIVIGDIMQSITNYNLVHTWSTLQSKIQIPNVPLQILIK